MTLRKERRWIELKAFLASRMPSCGEMDRPSQPATLSLGARVCPVGTDAYVENVIRASAKRAAALIPILDLLLISKDSGSHAPDERDLLIRLCVCRGKQNNRRRWGRRGSLDEGVGASPPVVYSSSEASSDGKAKGHPDHRGEPGCSPRGLV